jgi:hypothetical protein
MSVTNHFNKKSEAGRINNFILFLVNAFKLFYFKKSIIIKLLMQMTFLYLMYSML